MGLMRKLGEADEESLASIENEVDRLTRMVGDLLLLAQAEAGAVPLDMASGRAGYHPAGSLPADARAGRRTRQTRI